MLSFAHPSGLNVATHILSKQMTQHMMASAVGTIVIVQEYDRIDPTALKQLMVNELTKDDVKLGAELTQSEATKTLRGGIKLNGLHGTLKSRTELKTFDVFSYGKDGRGVILVSFIDEEYRQADNAFVDKFWQTLVLKF
jgi:hypothetical protein